MKGNRKMNLCPDDSESKVDLKLEERTDQIPLRPWIAPTFERVSLNEALDNLGSGGDFNGRAS